MTETQPTTATQTTLVTRTALLELNPRHQGIRAASHDIHRLHRLVMRTHFGHLLEGTDNGRQRLGILYAAQRGPLHDGKPGPLKGLLVQSQTTMDCSELVDSGAATVIRDEVQTRTFRIGSTVHVRIWANPTRAHGDILGARGQRKRLAIARADDAAQWMIRVMSQKGFKVHCHTLEVGVQLPLCGAGGRTVVLRPYQFQGVITDPQAFAAAVAEGVGRGKAYGAGLLHTTQPNSPERHNTPNPKRKQTSPLATSTRSS